MQDVSCSKSSAFLDPHGEVLRRGSVVDYFLLMKPRVMSLVLFTAFVGMMVAPGRLHPWLVVISLLCIAVGAGASGALNMWYDADIDALMARTASRPIPRGRLLPGEALAFGIFLSFSSVLLLALSVGWVAGLFLAFTIFFYVGIYTIFLKRRTVQNIVIGGAAGAFPPMLGWTCVTGHLSWASFSLFLVIFFWTPPHFWALSLYRAQDYVRAQVPMMPSVYGILRTRLEILIYSVLLFFISFCPYFFGIVGWRYVVFNLLFSALFLFYAIALWREKEEPCIHRQARRLFRFSIGYLFLLFCMILLDHLF